MLFRVAVAVWLVAVASGQEGHEGDPDDIGRLEAQDCPAIHQPDVKKLELRTPRHRVPLDTLYMCFDLPLPRDQEYQIVAVQTIVDNHPAVHHVLLFKCSEDVNRNNGSGPWDCKMGANMVGCTRLVMPWFHGLRSGLCFPPDAGIDFGKGSYGTVNLEVHHTNPNHVADWWDRTGVVIYYTAKKRPHSLELLQFGSDHIVLPPGLPSSPGGRGAVADNHCTARCTKRILKGPINIIAIEPHFHGTGMRMNVSITRPNQPETLVDSFNKKDKDHPFLRDMLTPPLVVRPGDEVRVTCEYNTTARNFTTTLGFGGKHEHCYGISYFYPKANLVPGHIYCSDWVKKEEDMCDLDLDCQYSALINTSSAEFKPLYDKVMSACTPGPSDPHQLCYEYCKAAVDEVRASHRCFGAEWMTVKVMYLDDGRPELLAFVHAFDSCKVPDTKM